MLQLMSRIGPFEKRRTNTVMHVRTALRQRRPGEDTMMPLSAPRVAECPNFCMCIGTTTVDYIFVAQVATGGSKMSTLRKQAGTTPYPPQCDMPKGDKVVNRCTYNKEEHVDVQHEQCRHTLRHDQSRTKHRRTLVCVEIGPVPCCLFQSCTKQEATSSYEAVARKRLSRRSVLWTPDGHHRVWGWPWELLVQREPVRHWAGLASRMPASYSLLDSLRQTTPPHSLAFRCTP